MPIGFWNDPDGKRYRAASYFERFPNTWHHGDFAEWTAHGGMIIHGRSDATLNPGGVRIGTAEIYRVVEQLPEVLESIVIGQQWDNDVRVVLFVILQPGLELDEALTDTIRRRVRSGASPRHVPARIVQVSDIPRTKSGKNHRAGSARYRCTAVTSPIPKRSPTRRRLTSIATCLSWPSRWTYPDRGVVNARAQLARRPAPCATTAPAPDR